MQKALYRKYNDRTLNSSTYHKKDGTNIRGKLKEQLQKRIRNYYSNKEHIINDK